MSEEMRPAGQRAEKRDEKGEKARGEKFRNDPLSGMAWAAVLIWAGIVFFAQTIGLAGLADRDAWPAIAVGAGVIFLIEALIRTQMPQYRRPIGGTVVVAVILIAVGFGDRIGWGVVGPIALIAVGAALLLTTVLRRQ